jgi:hypothetical protein
MMIEHLRWKNRVARRAMTASLAAATVCVCVTLLGCAASALGMTNTNAMQAPRFALNGMPIAIGVTDLQQFPSPAFDGKMTILRFPNPPDFVANGDPPNEVNFQIVVLRYENADEPQSPINDFKVQVRKVPQNGEPGEFADSISFTQNETFPAKIEYRLTSVPVGPDPPDGVYVLAGDVTAANNEPPLGNNNENAAEEVRKVYLIAAFSLEKVEE